ncbi:MAG: hypothetical protein R2784_15425 [Saprospiraceae bacterium]
MSGLTGFLTITGMSTPLRAAAISLTAKRTYRCAGSKPKAHLCHV